MIFDWQGFEWLVPDDNHNNVVVFLRRDQAGNELLCAVNFSPNDYENYRVGVPPRKRYVPAFTTDAPEFGGSGFADTKPLTVKDTPSHGKKNSLSLSGSPRSGRYSSGERAALQSAVRQPR